MIINKEIIGNELYLYMNGSLIYKRWLDTGASKVFDVMAYDKYTLASFRDLIPEHPGKLIIVNAKLTLRSTESGGRKTGIISGYRPNHVFEYNNDGHLLQAYIGDILFDTQRTIEPGETREVRVRFLAGQRIEKHLTNGRKWWIHEGPKAIGELEIFAIEGLISESYSSQ